MLDKIISSHARIELLKTLLLNDNGRYYLRELVKLTGLPQGSVQRELENLEKAGLILKERSGRQVYSRINERCQIIPELRSIFIKTVGVTGMIRTALLPETNSIRCAFIFGSYAAGSTTPESDIDLMIIGDITLRKIVSTLKPAQISREINPIVLSEREFRLKIGSHDHFFTSLIDSPKVYLIGDDNDFRRLIEARQA